MKKTILTLIILFSFISCKAQLGAYLNNLNDTELFDGIRFNNVSLGDIMKTSGDLAKMKALFGNDIEEENNDSAPFLAKFLSNDFISFGFEDETDSGNNFDLTFIKVRSSDVIINVKGLSIKIGDDKSKFGNLIYNPNSKSYNFTDADTGSIGLSFKVNFSGNISKISLICY